MQQHIHVTHTHPLDFGLRSVGLGLVVSLFFLVSCDFNGQTVPRYNTVIGDKRLPMKNGEFVGSVPQKAPAVPMMQAPVPAHEQTFMQVEPQSAPMVQPIAPTPPAVKADPRPIGYRDGDVTPPLQQSFRASHALPAAPVQPYDTYQHQPGVWDSAVEAIGFGPNVPAQQPQAVPVQQPVPVQQAAPVRQQDPFAGLPPLPAPPENFPRLQEVPEVPQTIASRTAQQDNATAELFRELERERQLSQQAQQMFPDETAMPADYFTKASPQSTRAVPQGNQIFMEDKVMAAPMAKSVAPAPMMKDEIVFETVAAPLPAPEPIPAGVLPPPPAQWMEQTPQVTAATVVAPMPMASAPAQVQPQAQALEPIQLRRPVTRAAGGEPIRLQAPSNPYGTGETLRSSRYVSRYATRRLQTTGSVY